MSILLSLCYQDLGDKVLGQSKESKGNQADGICSLIAYIFCEYTDRFPPPIFTFP